MSLRDKLNNKKAIGASPVDFNVTFSFSSFAFYTHFRIILLSHFIDVHFRAFAFYNFPVRTPEIKPVKPVFLPAHKPGFTGLKTGYD